MEFIHKTGKPERTAESHVSESGSEDRGGHGGFPVQEGESVHGKVIEYMGLTFLLTAAYMKREKQ